MLAEEVVMVIQLTPQQLQALMLANAARREW
jgi:hypothetical protein